MAAKVQSVVVNSVVVGGVMFCGWVLMKALSPTKEQMMKVSPQYLYFVVLCRNFIITPWYNKRYVRCTYDSL